jgi:hypothetical protein
VDTLVEKRGKKPVKTARISERPSTPFADCETGAREREPPQEHARDRHGVINW